jgi:hypothetical protein
MVAGTNHSCGSCEEDLRPSSYFLAGTAATQCSWLLRAMLFEVVLRRLVRMFFGMSKMRVGDVRVVRGPEMIARLMVLRGFRMVVSRLAMVMSSMLMMFDCLLRHRGNLHFRSQT